MIKQRRAVSEIIASMVLLAITVVGGILAFSLVSGNESITGLEENIEQAGKRGSAVKVIGFDTRDGDGLSGISGFNNSGSGELTKGTDSIVVKIRNTSVGNLLIHDVFVNEVSHSWDDTTAGVTFVGGTGSTHPAAGKFSMVSDSALVQFSIPELLAGQDSRLIIALSSSITADIELTEGIRIDITASDFDPARFIIPAGTAR